jgi:hypothetical protein
MLCLLQYTGSGFLFVVSNPLYPVRCFNILGVVEKAQQEPRKEEVETMVTKPG